MHMYYKHESELVRTGDILEISMNLFVSSEEDDVAQTKSDSESDLGIEKSTETFERAINPTKFYGIVITPLCDLAQPSKTSFLRIALLDPTPKLDKTDGDSVNRLQYLNEVLNPSEATTIPDMLVQFHKLLVLKNKRISDIIYNKDALIKSSSMSYNDTYVFLNNAKVKLTNLSWKLDNPYKSDLLHKFASHAGRVGTPDFTSEF